jgi:hypothetical protein
MQAAMWKREPVHWIGDAPTSLHGNGAASFKRTTRDVAAVTCRLCLTLVARNHPDRERIEQSNDVAGIVADIGQKHDVFMYLDLRYDIADALWAAGYRQTESDQLHKPSERVVTTEQEWLDTIEGPVPKPTEL